VIFDSVILDSYHDGIGGSKREEVSQRKLNCALFVKFL
jgi:hypothetical protein